MMNDALSDFKQRADGDVAAAIGQLRAERCGVPADDGELPRDAQSPELARPAATANQLRSSDWRVRAGALRALRTGKGAAPMVEEVLRVAIEDPDERVRGMALLLVARVWRSGRSATVMKAAAQVLRTRYEDVDESDVERMLDSLQFGLDTFELVARAVGMRNEVAALIAARQQQKEAMLRSLAGPDYELMASGTEAAEFLHHPLPERRRAALIFVGRRGISAALQTVIDMATWDDDCDVRDQAIYTTARLCEGKHDPAAKKAIARIVLDGAEGDVFRGKAYRCLLRIDGKKIPRSYVQQAGLPGDVDWNYVSSCAAG